MKDIKDIELFVFDLDGTVYLGDIEIDGSYAAIDKLRNMGKKVCFFTNNSSRRHSDYVTRLNNLGLKASADEIYTSGQVACEYINKNYKGSRVYLLGNDRLKGEFESYGINVVDENPDICVLGFDTSLTYDRLNKFCQYVYSGKKYIATHPDYFCPTGGCPMLDAGSMIEAIRLTVNKTPEIIMGKPYSTAGEYLSYKYNVPKEKIAMVGDRLYTDIAFGTNCGFMSILVLSGETDKNMLEKSDIKPDIVLNKVKEMIPLLEN